MNSFQLNPHQYQSPSRIISQHEYIEKTFRSLDRDNSGMIRKDVILSAAMYTSDYYDRQIIEDELRKCSEEINFQKFSSIFEMAIVQKEDTSGAWIFKLYDKEGKGYINKKDLLRASELTGIDLREEQIEQMLRSQNPNLLSEGKVYFDDFIEIMNTQISFQ